MNYESFMAAAERRQLFSSCLRLPAAFGSNQLQPLTKSQAAQLVRAVAAGVLCCAVMPGVAIDTSARGGELCLRLPSFKSTSARWMWTCYRCWAVATTCPQSGLTAFALRCTRSKWRSPTAASASRLTAAGRWSHTGACWTSWAG